MGTCGAAMGAFSRIKRGQENRAQSLRKRRARQWRRRRRHNSEPISKHRTMRVRRGRVLHRHRDVEYGSVAPRVVMSLVGLLVSGGFGAICLFAVMNGPVSPGHYHFRFTGVAAALAFLAPLFCVSLVSLLTVRTGRRIQLRR